jgi:AcrR family transcriptional regulator
MGNPEPPHVGRPRSHDADEAILRATAELLAEGGLEATTIRAVAERAGVARATIYLRYPSRDALIGGALRSAVGRAIFPLTGDLEADLQATVDQARAVLAGATFRAVFPSLVQELLRADRETAELSFERLFPNLGRVADEYRRLAGAAGFRTDIDAEIVVDLIVGAHVVHLLATGQSPSRRLGKQAVDIVLDGIRQKPVDSDSGRSST